LLDYAELGAFDSNLRAKVLNKMLWLLVMCAVHVWP